MSATTEHRTMAEVRAANARAGYHWFSAETMRFFNSRVCGELVGGRYFVTSERYDYAAPRLYTVREVLPTGEIETVGDFQGYTSARAARRAIAELLA